ncbi:sigma-70 family RNA polymerase sigma factor [Romboutsia weinsteinii]|uniref:Sigma-70 family RNA polymerase sigma factor n=1 Tax=Romboutsia weinsteinii TaxID=2020949 RepID=A0A371J8G5_9FIRM|nr:sigma-70 family RNA polymerase sigma factor [Romboutsia weinsteinii]RDY28968.1 sigma-70 family RNA polymerase sigma factor [Romboutsia weinsteinii]
MDDILKVQRAIKGDKEAFKELMKDNKQYLFKMAYLHTKYEEDAKDIFQESIMKAYKGIKNLKNPEYFKTWITRILINTANSYLLKVGMVDLDENVENHQNNRYVVENNSEVKIDLYNAIDTLEEKYKNAIILRYYYDLKIDEIAEILEANPNTIKTYIRKALKDMKNLLKEDYINEEI